MFIQHVKSNLKRGVDATLGKRTIITGPNGSGKTSIQNAIELALTGSASDVEGRAVVRKGDMLAKLGPPGEGVTTVATLEDGRSARWSITPNRKGGFFEPAHQPLSGVRVVFPVQEVREVLTGSPDSLRMWLMSRVGANATLQDVLNGLAAKHVGLYKDRAGRVRRAGLTEVDVLLAAIDSAYTEARALSAEAKAAKAVVEAMSEGLGAEPYAEDIQNAQRAADEAMRAIQEAQSRPASTALPVILAKIAESTIALTRASEELAQLRRNAPALHPQEQQLVAMRRDIAAVCRATAHLGGKTCLACGAPVAQDVAARADKMEKDNAQGLIAVEMHKRIAALQAIVDAERAKVREATQAEQDALRATSSIAAPNWDALNAAVDRTRTALVSLQNSQRQWRTLRSSKDQAQRALDTAQTLKAFAEDAESVVETLLQRAAVAFEAAVQSHLPSTDVFRIQLLDGKKAVCRVGLMRNEVLHSALSGAEWARLTLALGCATFRPGENTLAIFIPEERAFDPDTLASVMHALDGAPGQVILQSPVPPNPERAPSGWAHIRLAC